jgi:CHAT domain-containing protein
MWRIWAERRLLARMIKDRGLQDLSPMPPTWSAVMDLLEAGGYDWFHVAAHGNFYPPTPDSDSAVWLQGQRALLPESFGGRSIQAHLKKERPGFFLNACHTSRQDWALTRLGGWPDRLVSKGAGFFLAPMWTVSDGPALTFAQSLYESLSSGLTVGESVRQARLAARTPGDPTWLAYSVYAHPNARLEVRN